MYFNLCKKKKCSIGLPFMLLLKFACFEFYKVIPFVKEKIVQSVSEIFVIEIMRFWPGYVLVCRKVLGTLRSQTP